MGSPSRLALVLALVFAPGCGDDVDPDGGGGDGTGGSGDAGAGGGHGDTFRVRGELTGLYEGTVAIVLDGGETLELGDNGPFEFEAPKPNGSDFSVEVAGQPEGWGQTCTVAPASGTVNGADVELDVACGGGPALVITEVGNCWFHDTSCWFEVHNFTAFEADLADYTLRSTGGGRTDPFPVFDSVDFALPSKIVPANGYLLVRGDAYTGLVDGPQVVHVRQNDVVPHWLWDGFIELLYGGRTIDFVRFGESVEPPTDAGAWSSGSAPALPSGEFEYGQSLARDLSETDTDAPGDWSNRAFPTAGGQNDIDEDDDDDGDGLPDQAERAGGTYAGLDLYAMGVREGRPDILVQIDWMDADDPGITPRREALQKVVEAFDVRGIAIHFDTGPLFSDGFDPEAFNLGGGNVVPYAESVALFAPAPGQPTVFQYKTVNFDVRLQAVSHYVLFGSSQNLDGSVGASGYAELPGNDVIITLGEWGFTDATEAGRTELYNVQAATLMHELGHNFGLRHGGGQNVNAKPNYVSIMNYAYQVYGLPVIGSVNEGDRYHLDRNFYLGLDCGVFDTLALERGPFDPLMQIDYSSGSGASIVEAAADESAGLGQSSSAPVDFDCDGDDGETVSIDLNFNGNQNGDFSDFDDWGNLSFVFSRTYQGNDHGFDPLTDDRQPVAFEITPPRVYFERRRALRSAE